MSEEEFAKFRTSLIAQFLEKFKNLDQGKERSRKSAMFDNFLSRPHLESRTLKAQVDSHRYDFKCNQILAEEVKLLTKTDIITFYESYIAVSAPGRRKFSSWITSSKIKTVDEMDTVGWALANAPQDADVAALKPILQEIFSRNKMISLSDLPDFKSGLNLAKSASPVEDWKSYYALAAKL